MGSVTRHAIYTIEEYLRLEEHSNVKHEFLDGQMFAMAGGTPEHGAIAMRIAISLGSQLRGRPCNVYSSDVRVRVTVTGLDTYPDLSIVCGREERDQEDQHALTNPVVIVEVLSPSTEMYDRSEKLNHYKRITTLQEVVLVSHQEPVIEVVRRVEPDSERWTTHRAIAGQSVALESVGCTLDVDEVHRDPLASR
ncbi:MAG: Uma2 family endonuclease [Proteobacteria bacterium]|nr:Uma2 family endonuclease [Pseudomonadota bacterium]